MTKYFFRKAPEVILLVTFFHCAGQAPPSGGLPDTTPPEIIESYPLLNTLYFSDRKIALKFSEYVDRSSVEQSIFFSPPVGRLSFDWGGADVEISFSDSLRQHTTYIMTVGTDVIDRRNRNRMASAFALPFSTGGYIDSAEVSGKVFGAPPDGIMVFAYKLDGIDADTLNPVHTTPYYLTQTGKDGTFKISNMAFGSYRLIAVRDQFKNLLYDPQIDEFGIAYHQVMVSREHMSSGGMYFRMAKEDTSSPFLSSARAVDRSHVLIRFSESLDTSSYRIEDLSINDTLKNSSLKILDLSFVEGSPGDVQLVTSPQESTATYRVTVSGARDLYGNSLNQLSRTALFDAATAADTTRAVLELVGIQDSSRNIQADDTLRCSFSEAVQRLPFEQGSVLSEPGRGKVAGRFVWSGSSSAAFIPAEPLEFGKWYSFSVDLDSLRDFSGNVYHDSVWVARFQTIEEKLLGSIDGRVLEDTDSAGRLIVTASEISNKSAKPRRTVTDASGVFRFPYLAEGKYTLFAFRDTDGDGMHSTGRPFPYNVAEKFSTFSDTLKVRARWPLEGIIIKIQ